MHRSAKKSYSYLVFAKERLTISLRPLNSIFYTEVLLRDLPDHWKSRKCNDLSESYWKITYIVRIINRIGRNSLDKYERIYPTPLLSTAVKNLSGRTIKDEKFCGKESKH